MASSTVAVIDYVFPNLDPERSVLEPLGVKIVSGQCKNLDDVALLAADAFAIMTCYYKPIDEEFFESCPSVRMVVRYGIGVDTIDVDAATKRGVMVVNVPDYCQEDVADHTCALLLSLIRKIAVADRRVKSGNWDLSYLRPLRRLRGRQAGFIGLGRIARLVAGRLAAFGVDSFAFYDPHVQQEDAPGFRKLDLQTLLSSSDLILLHAPETKQTRHLLNHDTLAKTKRGALVINTARGGLIDTDALVAALASGHLGGAGLDVVEGVPPLLPEGALLAMDNVVITPHAAFYTEESLRDLQTMAAEEVARVFSGERPHSLVNHQVHNRRGSV